MKNTETAKIYFLLDTHLTDCLIIYLTNWLIDHLPDQLTVWSSGWPTDCLIICLTNWLPDYLPDQPTIWPTDCLIIYLTNWLIDHLPDQLTVWSSGWPTDCLIICLICLLIRCTYLDHPWEVPQVEDVVWLGWGGKEVGDSRLINGRRCRDYYLHGMAQDKQKQVSHLAEYFATCCIIYHQFYIYVTTSLLLLFIDCWNEDSFIQFVFLYYYILHLAQNTDFIKIKLQLLWLQHQYLQAIANKLIYCCKWPWCDAYCCNWPCCKLSCCNWPCRNWP